MAEVDVRGGGIHAQLHAQRSPLRQLALELPLRQGVDGISGEEAGRLGRRVRHRANARVWPRPAPCRCRADGRSFSCPNADAHHSSDCHAQRPLPARERRAPQANGSGPPPRKPKLKKLRLALVLSGLSVLAVISTVFGMLMAVASDLPSLENRAQYNRAENSVLYADSWGCKEFDKAPCQQIAKLTGNQNRILIGENEISPNVKNAVIAIEDRRFYSHKGVDYTGIARAFGQDILQRRAAQGGSTITQQFVKNALDAQGNRSVFQKLREAALAYHLERQVAEGEDPHPVPQHRVLRERRLRHRVRRAHLLRRRRRARRARRRRRRRRELHAAGRRRSSRTRTRARRSTSRRTRRRCSPAMIASPSMYDPIAAPGGRQGAAQPGARRGCST